MNAVLPRASLGLLYIDPVFLLTSSHLLRRLLSIANQRNGERSMSQDTSGLYKSISTLGDAIAWGAAILGTPMLFMATKAFFFSYFWKAWGAEIAGILIWVMGAIEAYVIYAATSFLFTAGTIWVMTALAVRRFKE